MYTDQVLHPNETEGTLYILDSRQEDKTF
jgi:hypothetical protein